MDDPNVARFLPSWIAGGEEARVYNGELPYKLVIFDQEIVLLTLARRSAHPAAMLVRNAPFARSMSVLYDFFWKQSKPLSIVAPVENRGEPGKPKASTHRAAASNLHSQSGQQKILDHVKDEQRPRRKLCNLSDPTNPSRNSARLIA